jgi:hypothetical protein
MQTRSLLPILTAVFVMSTINAQTPASLQILAEKTRYQRTGRYEEVERLCQTYMRAWPTQVACVEFGRTPENRPMLALVASADGALTATAAKAKHRPVMVVQGGIHAGEIDGKDAGFLLLREMLEGRVAKDALAKVTLVFVPVFNIDGHERFGRWNRPNQVGPEEMGWRTTAQNFNLNRDYVKADAPEMQAMLRLLNEWDPILYLDLHVTDGAKFRHDISVMVEPRFADDTELSRAGRELSATIIKKLTAQGSLPLDFYPSFIQDDDPASGFVAAVATPRFAHGYWALHNRFAVLVETHSWKDYATRVRITHNTVLDFIEQAAAQGQSWLAMAAAADQRAATLAGSAVGLEYGNTEQHRSIDYLGYAYSREPSAISGAVVIRYDDSKPQLWKVPLYDEIKTTLSINAPNAGYLVPSAQAQLVADKLQLHGVQFSRVDHAIGQRMVEVFRAAKVTLSQESFEGHMTAKLDGVWSNEPRDIPAGSLFVPITQANARLVMTLLEPQASDSLASWGFFNTAFERKEYMEAYVVEDVARQMLAADPKLRAEFARRLDDPAFAKDARARMDFFYSRHASWDERLNLYPIYRLATAP